VEKHYGSRQAMTGAAKKRNEILPTFSNSPARAVTLNIQQEEKIRSRPPFGRLLHRRLSSILLIFRLLAVVATAARTGLESARASDIATGSSADFGHQYSLVRWFGSG